jgi:uncharacterized protein (TIGR02285 family)
MPLPIQNLPALTAMLALALLPARNVQAGADEPLTLGFVVRPGLAEVVDGVPRGTYLPVAAAVADEAHLKVSWEALPQPRLIEQARINQPNYCAVGTYQTAERSAFAKFSKPFFFDKPLVIVTLKKNEAVIRKHASLAALTADTRLKVGLLEGFSYGPRIDAVVARMHGNVDRIAGSSMQNLSKLMLGRFDYTVGAANETPRGVDGNEVDARELALIEFPDMAPGATRHFMCSASVDDTVIRRLDAAIKALRLAGD